MNFEKHISRAEHYKRSVASKYLPIDKNEIISKIREADKFLLSKKYDGHLYHLCIEDGEVALVNHGGRMIKDLPLLEDARSIFDKCKIKNGSFPGELYFRKEGRSRSFDLTENLDEKHPDICFAVFDLSYIDDIDYSQNSPFEKQDRLKDIFSSEGRVHNIDPVYVESRKEIIEFFKKIVDEEEQEGIIVKSSEGMIYKIKSQYSLDGVVIGYIEGEGKRSGMLKELLVANIRTDNSYQIIAKVGNGFSDDERVKLLEKFKNLRVESNYIQGSSARVAFSMVKPEIIIEFSTIDILTETTKNTIRKMCLNYSTQHGYMAHNYMNSVSCVNAVFSHIREDKKCNKDDISFSQIEHIVELPHEPKNIDLKKSKILKRLVYVKESKGLKMVRKFLLWKTNKETNPDYPVYVFHYTDFSSSRKDMLKKEIKVSDSKKQIEQIFSDEISENVKKGWELA